MKALTRPTAVILALTLIVVGCSAFVSHYDAVSYQYFTELKAFHLQFIDDFTEADGRAFDEAQLASAHDAGNLRFREAIEYAKGRSSDASRISAIENLQQQFESDCSSLHDKKALFKKAFAEQLSEEVATNYDYAIAGEYSRVGNPNE